MTESFQSLDNTKSVMRQSVESCRQLIALYEAKIKRAIDKVWDSPLD